jgi:hypothetical protein
MLLRAQSAENAWDMVKWYSIYGLHD